MSTQKADVRRHRENQERTLGAQRIRTEQTQVGEGMQGIFQKGMAETSVWRLVQQDIGLKKELGTNL